MRLRLLSSVLRHHWLIERNFAVSQLPLIASLLKGNHVVFSSDKQNTNPYFTDQEEFDSRGGRKPLVALSGIGHTVQATRYRCFDEAPEGSIALIPVTGPILKYGGECGEPGSIHMTDWVKQADASSKISALLIRIDSPGGMVDGTATLADAIKNCGKPVIGFIDDGMMASAAMWIGSACDELYASQPTDSAGSIGVYTTLYDFQGYFETMGIKVHEIYAPQSTEKNLDYRQALEGKDDLVKADLKFICDEFINTIKSNRAGKLNLSAGDPFKGAMFFAKEAIDIGLIDGIKSFDQVVNDMLAKTSSSSTSKSSATSTSENMFGSNFKKIAALKGKPTAEITTEELQAANAELVNEGITGVVLGPDQSSRITELEDQVKGLQTSNEQLTQVNGELKSEVERLGKQPGEKPTNPDKKEESAEVSEQEKSFKSYGHNKEAIKQIENM